ncbi:MAG: hypothetical protein N2504_07630, partial [candidate division WOR-3 bacterium]|nr:hypothetical protein [candidate division WOR-3 bacterium]
DNDNEYDNDNVNDNTMTMTVKYDKKYLYQLGKNEIKYILSNYTSHFLFPLDVKEPRYLVLYRKISEYLLDVILIDLYNGAYIVFHDFIQAFNFARDKENNIIFKFVDINGEIKYIKENEDEAKIFTGKIPEHILNIWKSINKNLWFKKKHV